MLPLAVINFILGIGLCFTGFRFWRLWLGIEGLFLGGAAGVCVGMLTDSDQNDLFGAGAIGAILCASLSASVVPVGTFLVIVLHGAWIAVVLSEPNGARGLQEAVLFGGCVAVIPALLAAVAPRPWVILYSSFSGAHSIVAGAIVFASMNGGQIASSGMALITTIIVGTSALGLIGTLVQFAMTAPKGSEEQAVPKRDRDTAPVVAVEPQAPSHPPDTAVLPQEVTRAAVVLGMLAQGSTGPQARKPESSKHCVPADGSYAQLRQEITALREQLQNEQQREKEAPSAEQRALRSELEAMRAEHEVEGAKSAVGAIISLIAFGLVAWWFLAGGGSGEVARYLFWQGMFNK